MAGVCVCVEGLPSAAHDTAVLSAPAALHFRKCYSASWMLLISFLLDMAVGTITRHLSLYSRSGESRPQTTDP